MMTQTLTLVMLLVTFVVIGACITENLIAKKIAVHLFLFYLIPAFMAMLLLVILYTVASCIVSGIYKMLDLFRKPSTTT